MAGVLIYTSAPDSEGTLGGLCALGEPDKLNRHIKRALEKVSLCSSDPLCSEHNVGGGDLDERYVEPEGRDRQASSPSPSS